MLESDELQELIAEKEEAATFHAKAVPWLQPSVAVEFSVRCAHIDPAFRFPARSWLPGTFLHGLPRAAGF